MLDISIIIPVYNSELTLIELTERLIKTLENNYSFEIIFVNDGSKDNSYNSCKDLALKNKKIKFVSFYKNFGQINAVLAGMKESNGDICILMDDDLQNPPEEIPKLVSEINKGYDFVYGIPEKMNQNFMRLISSKIAFLMSELMFDKPKNLYPTSFTAIKNNVIKEIIKYEGPYPYVAGLILRVTKNGTNVIVKQLPRKVGKSQYNLIKLLRLWLSGFTNFSIIPLRIASLSGLLISLIGFAILTIIIIQKLFFAKYLSGWSSVIGSVLFFSGIQLLALGMLGEYVGRIFMILNKTPQYSIKEKYNCE